MRSFCRRKGEQGSGGRCGVCGIWAIPWVAMVAMFFYIQRDLTSLGSFSLQGESNTVSENTPSWSTSEEIAVEEKAQKVWNSISLYNEQGVSYLPATVPSNLRKSHPSEIQVWPSPKKFTGGTGVSLIHPALRCRYQLPNSSIELDLQRGFQRFAANAFPHRAVRAGGITEVLIQISDPYAMPKFGMNESYELQIPRGASPIVVKANTIFGVYHALETLSQLIEFDFDTGAYQIWNTPWKIDDAPRYRHRGVLMDTARHFLPLPIIKRLIDSMKLVKMNTLHWHLVDEQSFPIEIPSRPLLAKHGAYSKYERYSVGDMKEIVEYARRRGMRVVPEVDTPGHAASWCKGYPEVCPSTSCLMPLNLAKPETFELIMDILTDLSNIFPDEYIHLGGDEVLGGNRKRCWGNTRSIKEWLDEHHMSEKDGYLWFLHQVLAIGKSLGKKVIMWDDTFENFPNKLDKSIIINHWLHRRMSDFTHKSYTTIFNALGWYIDDPTRDWDKNYGMDPCDDERLTKEECDRYVLGGETSLWSENIDSGNLFLLAFPRVGAIAEKLWSPNKALDESVRKRMHRLHCRLFERGFGSSLFSGHARVAPGAPGSCMTQRRL